jgi:hypothetical protein
VEIGHLYAYASGLGIGSSLPRITFHGGYRRTGATQPFPYGDERFGTPLRDDLHFIVLEREL